MKSLFSTRCLVHIDPVLSLGSKNAIGRGFGYVALLGLFLVSPVARADSILLRGGERLIGRLLVEEEGKIQFESQTLGLMVIPRDRIERIERDAPPPPPEPAAAPESDTKEKDANVPVRPPEATAPSAATPNEKVPGAATPPTAGATEETGVDAAIMPAPPPEKPTPPAATAANKESAVPAPPPAATTMVAEGKESIVPAPPPEPSAPPKGAATPKDSTTPLPPAPIITAVTATPVVVPAQTAPVVEGTPAVSPPASAEPVKPKPVTIESQPVVTPPPGPVATVAPVQVTVAPVVAGQPAPAPAPVFYPWSGLKTDQDTFDWIQLKSGEWLKGKIKSMQDEKLEFDSEEMDYREIDWEDVTMLRSPRLNSVWFEKTGTADGSLLITPKEVRVVSKSGTNTYPRSDLLAITQAGDKEFHKWSGEVSLGFNLRTGNAEEASYNAHINLQRRTPNTRLILDYLGNYSQINGSITSDNLRETTTFDYFLSRKLYIRAPDAEIYRDPLQNIARRLTLGASVGYDFIRKSKVEWDVSAGPAYQDLTYESVEPGASAEEKTATMVLSSHLDIQLTKRIDWTVDYRGQYTGKKAASGNSQHINTTLEFDIHKRLNLDISAIWDHVGSPKTETGGTTPSSDDFRLITSLGIDF